MKNKALKRLVGAVLAVAMIGGYAPLGVPDTAKVVCAAEPTSDADFTQVTVSTAANFAYYVEANGNYKISLSADISDRIGSKGDANSEYKPFWKIFGLGTKVIDLNGYDISL